MNDQPADNSASTPFPPPPVAGQSQSSFGSAPAQPSLSQPAANLAVAPSRTWEVLCHLSALAGYVIPFGHIIGPLVVWLLKRGESPSVDAHGKESLNFQISVTIYAAVCMLLILVVIGIPMLILLGVISLVLVIVAAVKASSGEFYRYPLTIRLIK
jgi:uncharacterized Tic20 family protein